MAYFVINSIQALVSIVCFLFQIFVIFPYSALRIPRQQPLVKHDRDTGVRKLRQKPIMISDKVHTLCTKDESVSSLLSKNPTLKPSDAWKSLYGHHLVAEGTTSTAEAHRDKITPEDLERARECGRWGPTNPSDLFLRIYHDVLCTLDHSVNGCMVSPSLMGSYGNVPLTVISVVPDIVRHMSNLIVRADKEVILATNYWQNSVASSYITNAMRELSKRAGERGSRIVFKVQYDRGAIKQVIDNHYIVAQAEYTAKAVALPAPEDIPNIDLEVMNYHRPMLGTFHAKYMIVDRKIAILQSNNIQDNDNMEMMVHIEGAIVDSLYDMAILSWSKSCNPPLPCLNTPAANNGNVPEIRHTASSKSKDDEAVLHNGVAKLNVSDDNAKFGHIENLMESTRAVATSGDAEHIKGIHEHTTNDQPLETEGSSSQRDASHQPKKNGPKENFLETGPGGGPDEASLTYFSSGGLDTNQVQILKSQQVVESLPEHTSSDPHYDIDISREVARVQAAVSPSAEGTRIQAITAHLNHTTNVGFPGTAPDPVDNDEMTPYILHDGSQPIPMAMVNREPYGTPNHQSVYNPQNEAWLSGLRHATKNVFIQTPNLNAEPLLAGIAEACERGIDVFCYVCLGYNDAGELLPMQGGTNEMTSHHLYSALSPAARERLHYFWYVAKDQTYPIVAKFKKRACHIKLMIVDERIGIQGSGNQDTQSWYHSQEVNVLLESESLCRTWIEGLRRNQNTLQYGMLAKSDGIWRDDKGSEAVGAIGVNAGKFAWMKGIIGAVDRVRGTGGF